MIDAGNRMRAGLLTVLLLVCGRTVADDWPQWRGPRFDGTTAEAVGNTNWTARPPQLKWEKEAGRGYSGISIRAGKAVYIGNRSNQDVVTCVDAVNGTKVWEYSYAAPARAQGTHGNFPGPRATPTVTDRHVYTLSQCGQLKCLALADGSIVWETQLLRDTGQRVPEWYGFCATPLLVEGVLHINHGTRGMTVDSQTGEIKRRSDNRVGGYASPQLRRDGDIERIILFGWNTVSAVDPATGDGVWSIPWRTRYDVNAADPVICKEGVFVTSGYEVGCAVLDPRTGKERWRNKSIRAQCSPVVYHKGHVYGLDEYINAGAGYLVCVEAATGKERWRHKGLMGNVIVAGDHLLLLTNKGELLLIKATAERYVELGRTTVLQGPCWIPPSYADRRVYCRSNKGTVACMALGE